MWWTAIASAATLTVGSGGTYPTLQQAIEAAASGDTLEVAAGTYAEAIDVQDKALSIRGVAGSAGTVLAPPAGEVALTWQGAGGLLEGFTLAVVDARALELVDASPQLRDLIIAGAGSPSLDGGALRIDGGSPSLEDVTIEGCEGQRGGALHVTGGALVTLDRVALADNAARWGGALYVAGAAVVGTDLSILRPRATYAGAGVYLDEGQLDISGFELEGALGEWSDGAGLYAEAGSELRLDGGRISGCEASQAALGYDGGALWLDGDSSAKLVSMDLVDNRARHGGAIASMGGALTLVDVTLAGNRALEQGGAISGTSSAPLSLAGCTLEQNEAATGGALWLSSGAQLSDLGSLWAENSATGNGGGLAADGALSVRLEGSTLFAHEARGAGGALWAEETPLGVSLIDVIFTDNTSRGGDGGAVGVGRETPVLVQGATFERNLAETAAGGALSVRTPTGSPVVTVSGSRFADNQADAEGGAVSVRGAGNMALTDSFLLDNVAGGDGGGLSAAALGRLSVTRTLVHHNSAEGRGGGIFETAAGADGLYQNVSWTENHARLGGGLALLDTAPASLINVTLAANGASTLGGHVHLQGGEMRLVNAIAAFATDGGGVWADAAGASSDIFYGLFWSNAGGHVQGSLPEPVGVSGSFEADPLFRSFPIDGDESNDDLRLALGSPAIDAGDPSLVDVDGSASDIGAWGGPQGFRIDLDQDGVYAHADCDDADPGRSPLVLEIPYDGADQDCDGLDPTDLDQDGFDGGEDGPDCADEDTAIHPDAVEVYYDGIDQDCDELSDFDADLDGSDASAFGGTDCDDADADIGPHAAETWYDGIDQDCSGGSDFDQDGDAHEAAAYGGDDCDDTRSDTYTGAAERCDHRDNDCDQAIDEEAVDPSTWWVDADYDGFGTPTAWVTTCWPAAGLSSNDDDCDDGDALVHPGATEIWYDGIDQDCDSRDDDQDGDGFVAAEDCDDERSEAYPGAEELRNSLDDDCDGWPEDADRDGDGLIDWDEWALQTDPLVPDTDGDSLSDGAEVSDPIAPPDADGDGLIDPLDDDDDGDFILTRTEATVDADKDGDPDIDVDRDGTRNHLDLDTDGDDRSDELEGTKDLDGDDLPDFADYQGPLTGGGCGGCSSGGSGGVPWLVLAALGALGLRRRGWALAGLTVAVSAGAQTQEGMDVHGFELLGTTSDPRGGLRLAEGGQREPGAVVALVADQANRPVVEQLPGGPDPLIRHLTTASAVISLTPIERLSFDAVLPVHAYGTGTAGTFSSAGDLRVGAQLALVERAGARPGLSLLATGWVPTGAEGRYVGAPTVAGGAVLALSQRAGPVGWTLDLGARLTQAQTRRGLAAGPGPVGGLGMHVATSPEVALFAELAVDGSTGFALDAIPLEAMGGVRTRGYKGRFFTFAAGAGLNDAVGAAAWRVALGGGFGPRPDDGVPILDPVLPEPAPVEIASAPEPEEPPLAALEDDRIVLREQVFFEEDAAALLPQSDAVLDAVRQVIEEHPEIQFLLIEGHTNHNGGAEYNYDLSQRRANSVRSWLVAHGIERRRLLTEGFGFDQPLLPPDDARAIEVNRRVEFVVMRSDESDR